MIEALIWRLLDIYTETLKESECYFLTLYKAIYPVSNMQLSLILRSIQVALKSEMMIIYLQLLMQKKIALLPL